MKQPDDEKYIRLAIAEAFKARENGNEPFGAILVKDDEIIYSQENEVVSKTDNTRHAELGLISNFCQEKGISNLAGYTLYSSCEPCFMCSGAIYWSKISRLVYSATQEDLIKTSGGSKKTFAEDIINSGKRKVEVVGGLLREEGRKVFEEYSFNKKETV